MAEFHSSLFGHRAVLPVTVGDGTRLGQWENGPLPPRHIFTLWYQAAQASEDADKYSQVRNLCMQQHCEPCFVRKRFWTENFGLTFRHTVQSSVYNKQVHGKETRIIILFWALEGGGVPADAENWALGLFFLGP